MSITLFCMLLSAVALAQNCPSWGDNAGALKFLQESKSNGTAADPVCVNRAFSTLAQDKSNASALIDLLNFERSTEKDHSLKGVSSRYPAIGSLMTIGKPASALLIRAIKENQNELIRTNAANALEGMYRSCEKELMDRLESEARKPEIAAEQQERLLAAKKYILERHGILPCKPQTP